MAPKLTSPQATLLAELRAGPQVVVCAYKPGSALIKMGLAIGEDDDWGHSRKLTITEAGRRHPDIAAAPSTANDGGRDDGE